MNVLRKRVAWCAVAIAMGCVGCGNDSSTMPARTTIPAQTEVPDEKSSEGQPVEKNSQQTTEEKMPNRELLAEVDAAKSWFRAKKTRPIWAKQLDKPERVRTLEGEEEVPAGSFLCRGEAGDVWPQTAKRLEEKYVATDEMSPDGWRKYNPSPDNEGVLAAKVDHPFLVEAKWGQLKGKAGDLLVKNYSDRNVAVPADVWIVDAGLFEATYVRVASP